MRTMLRALVLGLTLGACAAHNSHSLRQDPRATLDPLVEQALLNLCERLDRPYPLACGEIELRVERVNAHWLLPADGAAPAHWIDQAGLVDLLQELLQRRVAASSGEEPGTKLCIAVMTDLYGPEDAGVQVRCWLEAAGEKPELLGAGDSDIVRFERLYCHGCRDRGGEGSRLVAPNGGVGGDVFFPFYPVYTGVPGYTKN